MTEAILTGYDELSPVSECRFCELSIEEEVLLESDHAYSIPSLGAMVEGWMLVVPRRHAFSLAELDDADWHEFQTIASMTREKVEQAYGASITFEHGAAGASRSAGCGVNHAHLHVVPLAVDLRALIDASADTVGHYEWHVSSPRPTLQPENDYIHLGDRSGFWITHSRSVPSQVVRRAIARELHLDVWDWKSALREDLAHKTVSHLRAA